MQRLQLTLSEAATRQLTPTDNPQAYDLYSRTSEVWSVERLLWHRVLPERWRPPRHRGPLSKRERALRAQWGT